MPASEIVSKVRKFQSFFHENSELVNSSGWLVVFKKKLPVLAEEVTSFSLMFKKLSKIYDNKTCYSSHGTSLPIPNSIVIRSWSITECYRSYIESN